MTEAQYRLQTFASLVAFAYAPWAPSVEIRYRSETNTLVFGLSLEVEGVRHTFKGEGDQPQGVAAEVLRQANELIENDGILLETKRGRIDPAQGN